jgi:radial spoke head protein 9
VVPRHSYKFTPLQEVRRNEAFSGLTRFDALQLSNYHHLRPMQQQDKLQMLEREEAVYNDLFLDDITKDYPKQCWSVISDCAQSVATVRSLLWPGYYAYHRVNTPIFGGVYIGYGIRNQDLPFML